MHDICNLLSQVPVLIHQLIVVEMWKEYIFPEFVELELEPDVLFPIYMVVSCLLLFEYQLEV